MGLPSLLKTILQGYIASGRSLITVLLFLAMAGLVSLGIVYPLWFFSTSYPEAYTLFCAVLLGATLGTWLIRRASSHRNDGGRGRKIEKTSTLKDPPHGLRKWKKILRSLSILLLIYITIRFFGMGHRILGSVFLIFSLFLAGWLLYGPKKR